MAFAWCGLVTIFPLLPEWSLPALNKGIISFAGIRPEQVLLGLRQVVLQPPVVLPLGRLQAVHLPYCLEDAVRPNSYQDVQILLAVPELPSYQHLLPPCGA